MPDLGGLDATLEGFTGTALIILVVAVVGLILLRLSRGLVRRVLQRQMERQQRAGQPYAREDIARRVATLGSLFEWILRALIIIAAGLVVLVALDLTPVIAAVAIVLLAIGVVAQDVIRDYIAGVIIVLENQYGIGDYVTVAKQSGDVEGISLRRTLLRSDHGDLISVPNGEIRVARNWTRTWARLHWEIAITDASRIDDAVAAMKSAGAAMSADPAYHGAILDEPAFLGVARIDDSGVWLLIRVRIRAADRLAVEGEFRRRVLDAFLAMGVAPSMGRGIRISDAGPGGQPLPEPQASDAEAPRA